MGEFGRMLAALWNDFKAAHRRFIAATTPPLGRTAGTGEFAEPGYMGCRRVRGDSDESSGGPEAFEVCDSRVVEASHGTLGNRLTAEARERSDSIHWANHVWLHLARTLLLMNRNLSTVAVNVTLPMVAMTALAWAFPNFQME